MQIQRPLTLRQRRRQARKQAKKPVNRTRRNLLIALAAGGVLVGGGVLGKYLVDRVLSPQFQDLDVSNLHFNQLTQVAWSPDSRYLITLGPGISGEDFILWDISQKKFSLAIYLALSIGHEPAGNGAGAGLVAR